jgi:hypothetical protein
MGVLGTSQYDEENHRSVNVLSLPFDFMCPLGFPKLG